MVRADLENVKSKRRILHGERTTVEERNACADEFLAEGRFGEALEFLEITKDAGRLSKVLASALERGDTFLLLRVEKLRGADLGEETWRRAGECALGLERYHDAFRALERAGDEDRAEEIRSAHLPDYRPWKPEGK